MTTKIDQYLILIKKDYPDFKIDSVQILGEGMDNLAIEINHEYIFRFSKNYNETFETELKVLNFLQNKITLQIPEVEFFNLKNQYMGYKKIEGISLSKELIESLNSKERIKLVFDLVLFLREIHNSISIDIAKNFGVKNTNSEKLIAEFLNANIDLEDKDLKEFIKNCLLELSVDQGKNLTTFLHNDMHFNNAAFNLEKKELNGIFDFGDIAIGDLHQEFEGFFKRDLEFFREVIKEYSNQSGINLSEKRVMQYSVLFQTKNLVKYCNDQNSEQFQKSISRIKNLYQTYC